MRPQPTAKWTKMKARIYQRQTSSSCNQDRLKLLNICRLPKKVQRVQFSKQGGGTHTEKGDTRTAAEQSRHDSSSATNPRFQRPALTSSRSKQHSSVCVCPQVTLVPTSSKILPGSSIKPGSLVGLVTVGTYLRLFFFFLTQNRFLFEAYQELSDLPGL